MENARRLSIVLAMISILSASALARAANLSLAPFVGAWQNMDLNSEGITTILVTDDVGGMQIQVFSVCPPDLCDWGVVNATAYGRNGSATRADTFLATYEADHGELVITGSRTGPYLRVDAFTRFSDGSGRPDTIWAGVFSRE